MVDFVLKGVDISKTYGNSIILNKCSFSLAKAEVYGLIGKNGIGKTTLLKIISHIIPKNKFSGKLLYASDDYRRIGSLIESPNLFKDLSVKQNLILSSYLYSDNAMIRKNEMDKLVKVFQLENFLNKRVYSLSLGMLQKVRIALSFFTESKLIILDEPFNGLDIDGVTILRKYIAHISTIEKKSIIITSHNTEKLEQICDKFGILYNGKIIEKTKDDLLDENISLENLYLKCLKIT